MTIPTRVIVRDSTRVLSAASFEQARPEAAALSKI
jgi:hypothetical protein